MNTNENFLSNDGLDIDPEQLEKNLTIIDRKNEEETQEQMDTSINQSMLRRSPSFENRIKMLEAKYGQKAVSKILGGVDEDDSSPLEKSEANFDKSEEQNLIKLEIPKSSKIAINTKPDPKNESAKKIKLAKNKIGLMKKKSTKD